MVNDISGVILAGGDNKRFNGITKSNLVVEGEIIISRMLEVISSIFDEIIIVTNTPEEFTPYTRYAIVSDLFKNTGPLAGIHAAIKASNKKAVFVFAGDMPYLDRDLIMNQIDLYRKSGSRILVPKIANFIEPLHAIYNNSVLNEIESFLTENSNRAVWRFLIMAGADYTQMDETTRSKKAFLNINSPSDIDKL